jgi:hypothetical protein
MKKSQSVIVKITDTAITKSDQLHVYVTGPDGSIVESAAIKNNEVTLTKSKEEIEGQHRIYISPEIPKQLSPKADERMLIKGGAYQLVNNFTGNAINVFKIPAGILKQWYFGNCLITGTITNTITIDGVQHTVPVCHARVHLVEVEVEWRYIYRPIVVKPIPSWVLSDIGHKFRELFPEKPHIDPGGPVEFRNKTMLPLSSLNAGDQVKLKALPPPPSHVIAGLTSTSVDVIKKTIVDYHELLYPYFCYWPWYWYWLYEMDEDNIIYTDCNGRFEYWENTLTEDGPLNIYAWVEVEIGGVWTTVYRPFGVPCNTYWNYVCGTPININVYNANIPLCNCNILPGQIVFVKSINGGTRVRTIALQPTDSAKPSLFADARGLTKGVDVRTDKWVSPFSGSFSIVVQFGSGYPSATTKYFRWKYRKITNADLFPDFTGWKYQEGALSKAYTYEGPNAFGVLTLHSSSFPLDVSLASGKAYIIPNADASVDTGRSTAHWDQDTNSININAITDFQNGIYEFVLELLDAGGHVVNVSDDVFQIDVDPFVAPLGESTPAKAIDPGYVQQTGGVVNGFRFLIRIDNDRSTCGIDNAIILNGDGTTATSDTLCGFAEYKDKATGSALLRFNARQPHGYADFSFRVIRGNGNAIPAANVDGQVPEPHISVPTAGGVIDCQVNPTLNEMLGSCIRGAFAETLSVKAYHTNGSPNFNIYDCSDLAAFATTPEEPGT